MLPPAAAESAEPPRGRDRRRRRRRLLLAAALGAAALGAAALGAAAAAAALLALLRAPPAPQGATAAHVLLSAGSLVVPSQLPWRYEEGISGVFVSGDVQPAAQGLRVDAGGLYLLYGQFALACTEATCPAGTVTLQVLRSGSKRPLLAVPLALTPGPGPARSELTQAVGHLQAGDVLSLVLTGELPGDSWQLSQDDREGNFVGMIRIATD